MKKTFLFVLSMISMSFLFAQGAQQLKRQNNIDTTEIRNYRGSRVPSSSEKCVVEKISYGTKAGISYIDIFFTMPVDPKSFENAVLIDGKKIDALKNIFNREGTQCRFFTDVKNLSGKKITVKGVLSYDGKAVAEFSQILK